MSLTLHFLKMLEASCLGLSCKKLAFMVLIGLVDEDDLSLFVGGHLLLGQLLLVRRDRLLSWLRRIILGQHSVRLARV